LVTAARRGPGLGSHFSIAALLVIILVIFFADNAWRVLWGQRPHVDYSSGVGPVTYLLSAWGVKLAGGNLNGLGYGNTLAGVAIGFWAYGLLVRRVSGVLAVAGAAMMCLLALGPVQLGESFRLSTIAMSYNRQGYALLGLLIVESFPLRPTAPVRGGSGGFSTGALVGILLFLKANYFLVGLVLAAVSLVWSGRLERRRLGGMGAGFAVVAMGFSGLSAIRRARDAGGFAHGGGRTQRGGIVGVCHAGVRRELSGLPDTGRVGRDDSGGGDSPPRWPAAGWEECFTSWRWRWLECCMPSWNGYRCTNCWRCCLWTASCNVRGSTCVTRQCCR
jgi:hypothetical protein